MAYFKTITASLIGSYKKHLAFFAKIISFKVLPVSSTLNFFFEFYHSNLTPNVMFEIFIGLILKPKLPTSWALIKNIFCWRGNLRLKNKFSISKISYHAFGSPNEPKNFLYYNFQTFTTGVYVLICFFELYRSLCSSNEHKQKFLFTFYTESIRRIGVT